METFFIVQPCNTLEHFLALEMYVYLHRSATETNHSEPMIQQLCGHQTWHRAVFVYVCWSRVLVQMDRPSWTGSRFEAHPLECWTAPPPSVHSPAAQSAKESPLLRYGSDFTISEHKGIRESSGFTENFFRRICGKWGKFYVFPLDTLCDWTEVTRGFLVSWKPTSSSSHWECLASLKNFLLT